MVVSEIKNAEKAAGKSKQAGHTAHTGGAVSSQL